MTSDQYDEEQTQLKLDSQKQNQSSLVPAINASSKRAASQKRVYYEDYLDDTSYSKTRRRNRHNGKSAI